jgi:fructose-specific phosphotransferase system IIC component
MDDAPQQKAEYETQKVSKRQRWFAGYIVAGFVLWLAQSNGFDKNTYDAIIILVVAILCGIFYHRIKAKIKGKEWLRIVGTFLIIEVIAAVIIGFLTAFFK